MVRLTGFHYFTPDFALCSGLAASPNSFKALDFIIFEFYTLVPPSQSFTRHGKQLGTLFKNAGSGCMPEARMGWGWRVA